MYLARVSFGPDRPARVPGVVGDLEDAAHLYLSSLYWNGQVCGDYLVGREGREVVAFVGLQGPDASAARHEGAHARRARRELVERFAARPRWRRLTRAAGTPRTRWRSAPSFYLFTSAVDVYSPVCRGDSGAPVPLYHLPLPPLFREHLISWGVHYRQFDDVWLGSSALEIPAYRQMAEIGSETARSGRELCRKLERACRIPVYYFLIRYYGRRDREADRVCPGCGGVWRDRKVPATDDVRRSFHEFPFRCRRCRLVSDVGVEFDEPRLAGIGEWRGTARRVRGRR